MGKMKKIMIIDDDEHIRLLLKELLESKGYHVSLAKDGLEGMSKLKDEPMDLLLLDVKLPYISGIGLIKIARQHKPEIPIICMTGYGSSPESLVEEECVEKLLRKPFKTNELIDAINEILK